MNEVEAANAQPLLTANDTVQADATTAPPGISFADVITGNISGATATAAAAETSTAAGTDTSNITQGFFDETMFDGLVVDTLSNPSARIPFDIPGNNGDVFSYVAAEPTQRDTTYQSGTPSSTTNEVKATTEGFDNSMFDGYAANILGNPGAHIDFSIPGGGSVFGYVGSNTEIT